MKNFLLAALLLTSTAVHAEYEENPGARRIVVPFIKDLTKCVARQALTEAGVQAYRGNGSVPFSEWLGDELNGDCHSYATTLFQVYQKAYGHSATKFIDGPYKNDLERAVMSLVGQDLKNAARIAAEAEDFRSKNADADTSINSTVNKDLAARDPVRVPNTGVVQSQRDLQPAVAALTPEEVVRKFYSFQENPKQIEGDFTTATPALRALFSKSFVTDWEAAWSLHENIFDASIFYGTQDSQPAEISKIWTDTQTSALTVITVDFEITDPETHAKSYKDQTYILVLEDNVWKIDEIIYDLTKNTHSGLHGILYQAIMDHDNGN